MPNAHAPALPLLAAALVLAACDGDGNTRNPGRADCDTDIDYNTRRLEARVDVAKYGTAALDTGKEAIREVDQNAERFMNRWKTVCKDYKNGALTREEYRDESNRIRTKMEELEQLAMLLENAGTEQEFAEVLRQAHAAVVPAESRADVSVEVQFMAKRPGEQQFTVAPPGATLATGASVYMNLSLSSVAYVYMYQIDANGQVSPLFPHSGMTVQNPLPAGQPVQIPPGGSFTLNDKDLGIEDVHIVSSAKPIPALENSLAQAGTGQGNVDAKTLQCNTRGLEYRPDCPRSRGLVYEGTPRRRELRRRRLFGQGRQRSRR